MKIAIAQQNYHIANLTENRRKIVAAIHDAKASGADLIVFSELSICGYSPHDLLLQNDFVDNCIANIHLIKEAADGIAVIVGGPAKNESATGKGLYNAAYFLADKEIKSVVHKTCIPDYDVFDEYRYFEPAGSWKGINYKGVNIALTICEDIWSVGDQRLYKKCPMDELIHQRPDLIINISASPFDYAHADNRLKIIEANVLKYQLPLIYCNSVGSQTDIIFDGGSLVMNTNGDVETKLPQFEEAQGIWEFKSSGNFENTLARPKSFSIHTQTTHLKAAQNIEQIHDALILGIRDYFKKMGFARAIIGSSGGIDSAVTIALVAKALGNQNVLSILMPSDFSTSHSVDDAVALSKNLSSPYEIIPIAPVYHSFVETLKPVFQDRPFNVAEENIQARSRGVILMGISNKLGPILLNTSNKSELAVGYGTLYGDMAGGLSILGDCYKTQVYELAKYINRNKEIIPETIISKAPSAELRPGQMDKDSLPTYEILDQILFRFIECRMSVAQIIADGFDEVIVKRMIHLVNVNEFKRKQFCPILRISPRSLGNGWKYPIVASLKIN